MGKGENGRCGIELWGKAIGFQLMHVHGTCNVKIFVKHYRQIISGIIKCICKFEPVYGHGQCLLCGLLLTIDY